MRTLAVDLYLLVAAYGLALPVSYANLPLLGQSAFMAIGAFGTLLLAAHGTPMLLAVLASVVLAAAVGQLVGLAAARLSGAPLALATWGLAWLAYVVLVQFPTVSGGSQGLTTETPVRLVSPALGLVVTLHPWVHVLVAALLSLSMAAVLIRAASGPWALDWSALRTGPQLADSLGVPVQRRRRALIAAAAAIGALGGAGTALLAGVVAPIDFAPLLSLQLFVAVLIGGTATWWGPAVGVAVLAALPSTADGIAEALDIDPVRARGVLTAVLLIAALALRRPVAAAVRRRLAGRRRPADDAVAATSTVATRGGSGTVLELRDVAVSYGAVRALDGVDLDLRAGEVHALVGPNGSGKSTVLRVAAGVIGADRGVVTVGGQPAPAPGTAAPRVRAGLVRTLQRTATLPGLSTRQQVEIGARVGDRMAFLGLRHLAATPVAARVGQRRRERAGAALSVVGLTSRASVPAARLDSAEQRLLQLARAVATGAPAVAFDEPAAGMSATHRAALAGVLRALADAGLGVLLVEHDMTLVGRAADRVTVLAEGRVLATGAPDVVRRDPEVRRAYLGDADDDRTGLTR